MNKWFEVKVKYQKIANDGKEKTVTESYLVDALSFTEAESRITEEMEPYIAGDFLITSMKIANYSEVLGSSVGDRWFKAKVAFITLDEERGIEKKSHTYLLIQANETKEIVPIVEEKFRGGVSDYEVPMVSETGIMDVFNYKA